MIKNFEQFSQTNEGFFDWLTGKKEETNPSKKDSSAGILDKQVEAFYLTLRAFAESGKVATIQNKTSYQYSKLVEDIQAALVFLGYKLPAHGVDGYFGPETASAIQAFNADTVKINTVDDAK